MRILGLDVGDVRTGVSISDPLRIIASPLTILNSKEVNVKEEIIKIVESRGVKEIIYGLPISLDGSEKRQAEKVREFIKELSEMVDVKFTPIDERYSTISAGNMFSSIGKKKFQKSRLDSVSATIILQNYLDSIRNK
ncbi:MAG TPA: Holliday junction resolvase RuvX [Fusobacteria bacterium]|nr:Holliday junction resolvase RuvX [Fusobacteriota bacterium]|tara:strand:+ start:2530 stop:2940 length:411 start_codon:yes stop_codon:yes gene_type:complete